MTLKLRKTKPTPPAQLEAIRWAIKHCKGSNSRQREAFLKDSKYASLFDNPNQLYQRLCHEMNMPCPEAGQVQECSHPAPAPTPAPVAALPPPPKIAPRFWPHGPELFKEVNIRYFR